MSLWKLLTARNITGSTHNVGCDEQGHLITLDRNHFASHQGAVFTMSTYLGGIGNGVETNLLVQVGSTKDIHMTSVEALTEGYWELEIFEGTEFAAAGTAIDVFCTNRFLNLTCDATWTDTPTLVTTTVDAASALDQPVLNVTATAGFVEGTWVKLDKGEQGVTNNEFCQIASIQGGVSLTMASNLLNNYTNETVDSVGKRLAHYHTEGGIKQRASGAGAATTDWLFKSGEDYLFRMTNRSGGNARASNQIFWLEEDRQT